jgi:protein O-mannosyl-transferase
MGRLRPILFSGGLALAMAAAYANHFQNEFHFDDAHTVVNNPFIRDLRNVPRFFADPALFSTMPDHQTYRPIVSASLAVDYRLGRGLKPFYFHLSTMVWFVVEAILLLFLFRRLMDAADPHPSNAWFALAAAAFYGLHPANAETVNYVIQRGDLYCTLGTVASILCFAAFPRQRRYGWYLVPAVAAMLSKAPALVYPFILLAYVYTFERPRTGWLRATAPAFAVAAAAAVLLARMTPATFNPGAASGWQYRITQPYVAFHYFTSFFFPTELSADSDWGYVPGPFSTDAIAGYLFVAALLAAAWRASRTREGRPAAFGILWFLLALVPTSAMPLAEVANDHRMFFAFPGLALAVFWTLRLGLFRETARLTVNRGWVRAAAAGMALALVAAAAGTRERNAVWRTEESLWRDVTVKSPRNGRGLMNYGLVFMGRGQYTTALDYFERALAYTPNYWTLETNIGIADGALGRAAEAERHFRRAMALAPEQSDPNYFYGRWLNAAGRTAESAAQLETAIRKNRLAFDARDLLRKVQSREGGQASAPDRTADRRAPTPESLLEQSDRYYRTGDYTACIAAAREAIALKPDFPEAYNNIAAGYNSLRMWDQGIQAAAEAVRLNPNYQLARNNLLWAMAQKRQAKAGR